MRGQDACGFIHDTASGCQAVANFGQNSIIKATAVIMAASPISGRNTIKASNANK